MNFGGDKYSDPGNYFTTSFFFFLLHLLILHLAVLLLRVYSSFTLLL